MISAIAENLHSMDQVRDLKSQPKRLKFINLHGNSIRTITSLDQCYYLEELDLSSNKITTVTGLEACESLQKLNLACNQIKLPSGLDFLYKLRTLNLSYNSIGNVKCLGHFAEPRFQLVTLCLHGNKLSSVPGVLAGIKRILTLRNLTIHGNPLCKEAKYRKIFGDCMPQLETVDDFPRSDESFSDSVVTESSVSTQPIVAPYIDKAVRGFRHETPDTSVSSEEAPVRKGVVVSGEGVPEVEEGVRKAGDDDYTELIKQVLTVLREEKLDDVPVREEVETSSSEETPEAPPPPPEIPLPNSDLDSLQTTNKLLLVELEAERERRWKSEKHITDLSDKLVKNERAIKEYEALNKSSEAGINGIRDLLLKEQGQKMKLATLLQTFKEKHTEVMGLLREREGELEARGGEVAALERTVEELRRGAAEATQQHRLAVQQARQEAQVQRKQGELLRHERDEGTAQVRSLQELLVTREQEHVREKGNLVPLGGEEFNKRVRELVENEREKHELQNRNIIQSAKDWQQKHIELEKEFRIALYLENRRYETLHASYAKLSGNLSNARTELVRLRNEDERKGSVIEKLKRSVGEQSGAIEKLRRCKGEIEGATQLRIGALEKELEQSTQQVVEMTAFQKENTILKGEVAAQQSVIEGLRAERNLWSKELAEQGAQLSLDRGKLQSELEQLRKEGAAHTAETERLGNALRIKECQLTDALETVSKLKGAAVQHQARLEELERGHEEHTRELIEEREEGEVRVSALREALQSSQEERDTARQHAHQLKDEMDVLKKRYKELKGQWEEKVRLLEKVEISTQEMVHAHSEKVRTVEEAEQAARSTVTQLEGELRRTAEAHLEAIANQEKEREEACGALRAAQEEREVAHRAEVARLEEEMRVILHQSRQLKQDNDAKLTKLAGALGEFTNLLQPK